MRNHTENNLHFVGNKVYYNIQHGNGISQTYTFELLAFSWGKKEKMKCPHFVSKLF